MSILGRFFKAAKNIVVEPQSDITDRIINKLDNISTEDKKKLDADFINFLRNNNSRLYFFSKKLKENSGVFIFSAFFVSALAVFLLLEYRNFKKNK